MWSINKGYYTYGKMALKDYCKTLFSQVLLCWHKVQVAIQSVCEPKFRFMFCGRTLLFCTALLQAPVELGGTGSKGPVSKAHHQGYWADLSNPPGACMELICTMMRGSQQCNNWWRNDAIKWCPSFALSFQMRCSVFQTNSLISCV